MKRRRTLTALLHAGRPGFGQNVRDDRKRRSVIDLHTHLWPHEAPATLQSYDELARTCEIAAALGVEQIAITEHCNRFEEIADVALGLWRRDGIPALRAAAEHVWEAERGAHLDDYVDLLVAAQDRGLPILIGLEVDHLPGANDAISDILSAYPFDLLLGSVHWIGPWLFDAYDNEVFAAEWRSRSVDDVWGAYVDAVAELAQSGRVDVVAHIDVIKVAGYRPRDLGPFEARMCAAIEAGGVAVEVSSAGLRKPAGELYPSPALLRSLCEAGVALTTATDAHRPEQLGSGYDDVRRALREQGVDTITTFSRRRRQQVPLT
jgi:histidinol-phosphatase (PHP family)